MRASISIHLSRFLYNSFAEVRVGFSSKRVVSRNFTQETFLDLATVLGTSQTYGGIRLLPRPHNSQIVRYEQSGRGSAFIQNVRRAKPLPRFRFRGEAPADTAGQLARKPRI